MLYEFECEKHGIFEKVVPVSEFVEETLCEIEGECGEVCKLVSHLRSRKDRTRHAYLTEVHYFVNKKGEKMIAGSSNDVAPPGWEKRSTGLLNEIRALTKDLNAQDRRQFQQQQEQEQRYYSQMISEAHSEMRNEMQGWDDVYKDLARQAMDDNNRSRGPQDRSGERIDFGYLKSLES